MLLKPLFGILFSLAVGSQAKLTGWPTPASSTTGDSTLCLADDFCIVTPPNAPADLQAAASRATDRLKAMKHRYLSPTHGAEFFPNGTGCKSTLHKLELQLTGAPTSIEDLTHRKAEDRLPLEAYKLSLSGDKGSATSTSSLGLLRALATFETLFFRLGDKTYAPFAPYQIDDKPLFPWRGVLLDTSRNFFSVDTLKRTIDTMQQTKLSVLQWHITDSQSWPLNVTGYYDLALNGAYDPWAIYSEADVREVVQYGAQRGVDVILEIDTPGHTSIIAHSRPELIACFEGSPWTKLANEPPAGQLRFGDPEVIKFTQGLFNAAIPLSASPYFGTGGDEVNVECMKADPPTQKAMKDSGKDLNGLLKVFTEQTHKVLRDKGKTPVVWEEMALAHGDQGLANDTLVTVWIDANNVKAVVDKGFKLVHAASEFFYLDCGQGGWIPAPKSAGIGNSWCDPFKTWMKMLQFDPYNGTTPAQHSQIMGGQASLWCEQTDETNVDSQLWPRAAAVAEVFWNGGSKEAPDYVHGMNDIRYRMVDRGIDARPLQPEWCALRPGSCNLDS